MANTTNFGWETPDDTDLVKDGAAAMRTLGNAIDASLVDLKGGTTGQILAKNTNTDMDFVWITNDQGDITAVNVSSPITGGGSSGSVTIGIQDGTTAQKGAVQLENSFSSTSTTTAATPSAVKSAYDLANAAIPKSLTTTTGDIIYASAANTPARLGIGSTGNVLTVSGGVPVWSAPAGGGKVLQVVSATYSTETTVASETFTDSGLSVSITPSSTSSKVLILVSQSFMVERSDQYPGGAMRLMRGSTSIYDLSGTGFNSTLGYITPGDSTSFLAAYVPMAYLDSPSTTSSTTYKTQARALTTANTGRVKLQYLTAVSSIIAMEIGA